MSLKTFLIVVGVLVVIFFTGIAGAACGGISSGTGVVDTVSSILGAPHLKTGDLKIVSGGSTCIQGNMLVVKPGPGCQYELTTWLDRRLVLKDGVTPGVRIVVQQEGLVSFKKDFPLPAGEEFRAFIERKRSFVFKRKTSRFTVTCVDLPAPPVVAECRFPLK